MDGAVKGSENPPASPQVGLELPFSVLVSSDEMEAYLSFDPKGLTPDDWKAISPQDLKEELSRKRVVAGLVPAKLNECLTQMQEGKDFANVMIAQGKLPVDGQDAKIVWHVDIKDQKSFTDETTGKIDYRERHVIKSIGAGALLVVKSPMTQGSDGQTVTGKVIKAKKSVDVQLVAGKNVEVNQNEKGEIEYRSLANGTYIVLGNRIDVNQQTMIAGDIDFSTGNIKCNGDLSIKGHIASGFRVEVEQHLDVGDMVESAEIIAGGNVMLHRGIKGQDKGFIKCGGSLQALYAERAVLEVQGDVEIGNALLECKVTCGGKVTVLKGKGAIIGGEIRAAKGIEAKKIGSDFASTTVLEAGIDFLTEKALTDVNNKIKATQENLGKIERVLSRDILEKGDLSFIPEDKRAQFAKIMETWRTSRAQLKELTEQKVHLLEKKQSKVRAFITAQDQMYSRVKLKIGVSTMTTDREYSRVMFYEDPDDKKIKYSYK
ncbi:MAG: DUF342 domain-containing protein [Nitrospirae bacterium]|nr:DUF342 domain-containing protein [Nitrospirota bacterium]